MGKCQTGIPIPDVELYMAWNLARVLQHTVTSLTCTIPLLQGTYSLGKYKIP